MGEYIALILAGIYLVVGSAVLIMRRKQADQAPKLTKKWATKRQWQYVPQDPSLLNRWDLPLFWLGGRGKALNIVTGPATSQSPPHLGDVRQALSFEYQYQVVAGRRSTTYYTHVVAVFLPQRVPSLTIAPHGAASKVSHALGRQSIPVESQDFNHNWRVTGEDERFAHAVLHPGVTAYLMANPLHKTTYCLRGDTLLIYTERRQDVANIDPSLAHLIGLIELIPEPVWRSYTD